MKKQLTFNVNDKVKIHREKGDMDSEDFGASGLVIHSNLGRFGARLNDTFFYFGTLKEFPEWCVIATSKIVDSSSRQFAIRIDSLELVEAYEESY
jgi:hypothetical protein